MPLRLTPMHAPAPDPGKTAADCMAEVASSRSAASVTWLYRQPHWPVPRRILGIPIRSMFFNRGISAALPPYYDAGRASRLGGALVGPLQRAFWWGLEYIVRGMFNLGDHDGQRMPASNLPQDLFFGGQVCGGGVEMLIHESFGGQECEGEGWGGRRLSFHFRWLPIMGDIPFSAVRPCMRQTLTCPWPDCTDPR